jgi:hypothetical protein
LVRALFGHLCEPLGVLLGHVCESLGALFGDCQPFGAHFVHIGEILDALLICLLENAAGLG